VLNPLQSGSTQVSKLWLLAQESGGNGMFHRGLEKGQGIANRDDRFLLRDQRTAVEIIGCRYGAVLPELCLGRRTT
jgi:hypothetical protein